MLLLTAAHVATAGERWKPPSVALRTDTSAVFVGQLHSREGEKLLRFTHLQDIWRSAPESVTVLVDPGISAQLEEGAEYLVGYSIYTRSRLPKGVKKNPSGPLVLNIPGAQPALFPNQEPVRSLLSRPVGTHLNPDEVALVIDGLDSRDPAVQRFCAVELTQRPQLFASLAEDQKSRIESVARSATSDPQARFFLLRTAIRQGADFAGAWAEAVAQSIIMSDPLESIPSGKNISLFREALNIVEPQLTASDLEQLRRWLPSPHRGIYEPALRAIGRIDAATEMKALDQLLIQTFLDSNKRAFLAEYRRQILHRKK